MSNRLPVSLSPVAGELPSPWITRHATYYGVPPLTTLRHGLPEAVSLQIADRTLSRGETIRLAEMFSTEAKTVCQMTFTNIRSSTHRFISK